MANALTGDPLVIDTTATGIKCERIAGVAFDASGTGTFSITDPNNAGKLLLSGDQTMWYGLSLKVTGETIDVTISSGVLYIYLGSGPR